MTRDRIKSFSDFVADKKIHKDYGNFVINRSSDRCAFLFMSSDFRECEMTVLVQNKSTLCSPPSFVFCMQEWSSRGTWDFLESQ